MRTLLLYGVLGIVLGTVAWPAAPPPLTEATVPRISLDEFRKALARKRVLVVDVRDAVSYARGHIPGAVLMPLATLDLHTADLKKSKVPIVTYCA